MTVSLGEEFRLKNFGLGYDKPVKFSVSQWRGCSGAPFIVWRVFWVLWHVGWLTRSIQAHVDDVNEDVGESFKWFIYLTNWTYLMLTIQSILHLFVVLSHKCSRNEHDISNEETTGCSVKLLWFFTNISFAASIVVTIFYWTLIFEELDKALSIMTHAVTTLYVVTDLFISGSPFRLLHFIYPMFYGLAYVLFSLIFHLADGTNEAGEPYIYSSLDWSKAGVTSGLALGVSFVATPLCHLFVFGLYTLRCFIHQTCCGAVSPDGDVESGKPDVHGDN